MAAVNRPPVLISAGGLDTTFGGDGTVRAVIGAASDQARGIVIQSDGRYVVAGWSDLGGGNSDFALVRFNTDGSLDASYSGDGKQTTGFAGTDKAYGVALQSNGAIVLAGSTTSGIDTDIALARYNPDGTLDTSFDGEGKLTLAVGTGASAFELGDEARSITIQSDGKFIVAGSSYYHYLLLRFNADGTLDASFSGDGKALGEFSNTTSIFNTAAVQGDGRIVAAGYAYTGSHDFGVARFDANGNLDTTFNSTGDKVFNLGAYEQINAVAVQADGKILLAGETGSGFSSTDAVLIRLNADGSFDTGFGGGDGIVTLNLSSVDAFNSVLLQADGKILAAGDDKTGFGEALIARFNSDGTLDTSFNGTGVFSRVFDGGTSAIYGLAMAPNGQVVAAGDGFTGGNFDFGTLRLASGVTDQSALAGSAYGYTVPAGAVFDAEGDPLTFVATLANGAALPAWLSFDAATRTFSGVPAVGDFGSRQVKVTASDASGTVAALFQLDVSTDFIQTLRYTNDARWNDTVAHGTPGTELTFSFMAGPPSYASSNETSTFAPMTAAQRQGVRDALQLYHEIGGVAFTEVADAGTGGTLRFGTYLLTGSAYVGYSSSPRSSEVGGDVWINRTTPGFASPASGTSDFTTLLHEIGHALGLKHPGNYDGSGDPPYLAAGVDNAQYTLMSYNERSDTLFRSVTGTTGAGIHYQSINATTPALYDVAAIQFLYGANTSTRSGNDTYSLDPATPFFKTLWDGGGIDTISVSNFSNDCIIDLHDGHFSSIRVLSDPLPSGFSSSTSPTYGGNNNLAIAYGSVIENASGGSGNDMLIGNSAGNVLIGGGGADTIILESDGVWGPGYSALNEGSPGIVGTNQQLPLEGKLRITDYIDGGSGADTLQLGEGNDAFFLHDALSLFNTSLTLVNDARQMPSTARASNVETIRAGGGNDVVDLTSADYAIGAVTIYGEGGTDVLWGNAGADKLYGGEGNDTLFGGAGNNVLNGGAGADVFQYCKNGGANDIIEDFQPALDKLQLFGASSVSELQFASAGDHATLTWGTQTIVLSAITASLLDASWFQFG